jgi:hypothetical protein
MKIASLEKNKGIQNFFVPLNNLYFDESLKSLKANEFKSYMALTYVVKKIGPNTKLYYSSKKQLFEKAGELIDTSYQTFLKHLKMFESIGLIDFENSKTLNIGYDISDSKSYGFTSIDIEDLKYLIINLDQNELKLYMAIFRILKGFNQKSGTYSYKQLKTWSGLKNKSIFIGARKSLVEKKLITTLLDLDRNTFTFKLSEINLINTSQEVEKEPRHTDLKPTKATFDTDLKPHIKKYIPFQKKYIKKSLTKNVNSNYQKQAIEYEKHNRNKIFLLISENLKTKHLEDSLKWSLIEKLILDVKVNGGFKGIKIKSTPDYYLIQESSQFGKNLDKILDRYFYQEEQEQRDNHAREIFLQVCEAYYPEKIVSLKDFKINEVSRHKLDKLIKSSPALGFWSDNFVYTEYELPNPSYDAAKEKKAKEYMNQLVLENSRDAEVDLEERMELISKFMPKVQERYKAQEELIFVKSKLSFLDFQNKCDEIERESEQNVMKIFSEKCS